MKKILLIILLLLVMAKNSVYAVSDPSVTANNRFGIHILFPEELDQAAKLVNSNGGQWGYVTIPIRNDDKNLIKWQSFLDNCAKLKIIPILRLATFPQGENWTKPQIYDPLDWANFLDSLDWPVGNRYIIVYNEPNHAQEWGGKVDPESYTEQLYWTATELKKRNQNFYILPAGFDSAVPTSSTSLDEYSFLAKMYQTNNKIFDVVDGWNSHSYPNPNFSGSVTSTAKNSIVGFSWEVDYINNNFGRKFNNIFITETGWNSETLSKEIIAQNYQTAFNEVWNKKEIIAVTPFLLSAQDGAFKKFSWTDANYSPNSYYSKVLGISKVKGQPEVNQKIAHVSQINLDQNSNWSAQKTGYWHQTSRTWFKNIVKFLINE